MATDTLDEVKVENILGKPFNCIIFNDDHHGMDEVLLQIIKAINCDPKKALAIMLEAHKKGRAVVITTHKERAEMVAEILEEIRLGTKVEPA